MTRSVSERYVDALARRDQAELTSLLAPDVDFRGLTPARFWESSDARDVVENILGCWFEESDVIERVVAVESDTVADRERVGYRFLLRNPGGRYLVEQQVYLLTEGDRITWMRAMCSGFRPAD